jgi:hypothetical protein
MALSPFAGSMPAKYANGTRIAASQWDVRIEFQLQQQAAGDDPAAIETDVVANIIMAPQHAKALVAVLSQTVKVWESQYGPLPDLDKLGVDRGVPNAQDSTGTTPEGGDDE